MQFAYQGVWGLNTESFTNFPVCFKQITAVYELV